MIFAIWFIIWTISAKSIYALMLPTVGLYARSCYTTKNLNLIKKPVVFFAVLFFLFHVFLSDKADSEAWVFSVRMIVIAALMVHLLHRSSEIRGTERIAQAAHLFKRWVGIVRVRLDDVFYSLKIQLSIAKNLENKGLFGIRVFRKRCRLFYDAYVNIFVLFISLHKKLKTIIDSRGGWPDTLDWKKEGFYKRFFGRFSFTVVGDIFLISIMCIIAIYDVAPFVPSFISTALKTILFLS